MNPVERAIRRVDRAQQRNPVGAFIFGVIKKYGDDNGGTLTPPCSPAITMSNGNGGAGAAGRPISDRAATQKTYQRPGGGAAWSGTGRS